MLLMILIFLIRIIAAILTPNIQKYLNRIRSSMYHHKKETRKPSENGNKKRCVLFT